MIEWNGFLLVMTLIGPNATLKDHEMNHVASFRTEQACEAAAQRISEKQMALLSGNKKFKDRVRVEHLCVPQG